MPLGLNLRIAVMFLAGYALATLEVTAEIVWKDLRSYNKAEGYQYGLKIIQILEEDRWKLRQLLSSQFQRGENLDQPAFRSHPSPPE
jgi:hypothetical protein